MNGLRALARAPGFSATNVVDFVTVESLHDLISYVWGGSPASSVLSKRMNHAKLCRQRTIPGGTRTAQYNVFLSHSNQDNWLAGVIADRFRAMGAHVWLDEMSLTGGDRILTGVRDGIRRSNEAVVLVSNESLKSQWVAAELGMALALKKRITGLLNGVQHDAMAPLEGIKSYELNLFEKFIIELRSRIHASKASPSRKYRTPVRKK